MLQKLLDFDELEPLDELLEEDELDGWNWNRNCDADWPSGDGGLAGAGLKITGQKFVFAYRGNLKIYNLSNSPFFNNP